MTFIKKEKGFTLIELMVVVAILAILAIVAVPRILAALDDARRSEATATATSVANALGRMYIEKEDYPAAADGVTNHAHTVEQLLALDVDGAPLSNYLDLRNEDSIETLTYEKTADGFELTIGFHNAFDGTVFTITPEKIVRPE